MTNGRMGAFDPEDLRFFGAITAVVSHELKNVSAIINESAGLLHDLSLGAESGQRALDPSRVKKLSSDIARNVDRTVAILNRMNRFAHSVDEPIRDTDLRDILQDTVHLASRLCSVRGVAVRTRLPPEPLLLKTCPFGLHRALFTAIELTVLDVEGVAPAEVSLSRLGSQAMVRLRRGAWVESDGSSTRRALLERLMASLGGEVVWTDQDGGSGIILQFPAN